MKNKKKFNIISYICIIFTSIILFKVTVELIFMDTFNHYTLNIYHIFLFSIIITGVFYFHDFIFQLPLILAVAVQYTIVMFFVFMFTFILSFFIELAESAYKDIFISFSTTYFIVSVVYYISWFIQGVRYNKLLYKIKNKKKSKEL